MLTCSGLVNAAIIFCWSLLLGFPASAQALDITETVSIIDVLSNSAQFSILLQHLQRTGLVPLLNEATNATFIAPTNSAFLDVDESSITQSRLLFHLLNQTIFLSQLESDAVVDTYLYSSGLALENNKPDLGNSDEYPLPVYVACNGSPNDYSYSVAGVTVVESDLNASKGHGVVQVVDQLLEIPQSVCDMLAANPATTLFSKIFSMEFNCSLPMLPDYSTILVPTDQSFSQLNDVELKYLLSPWAEHDRIALLSRHILNSFLVSPLIEDNGTNVITMDGTTLQLSKELMVNSSFVPTEKNILASDAAIHIYDAFITATGNIHSLINFTPKKYCLGLGAQDFVKEVKFRGLLHLIDGHTEPQTLFVPVAHPEDTPTDFFASSTNTVLYHFVYGQHNLNFDAVLNSNVLLESKSNHKKLGYGNQRIKVVAEEKSHLLYLNGRDIITSPPYVVGNTTIFAIRGSLDMPPTLDLAVGSMFQSSQSATYLNNLELLDLPTKKGWTVLLPTTRAWENLGLVKTYLESNTTALRGVLESLIFLRPFYSNSEPLDTQLLDGTNTSVHIIKPEAARLDQGRYFPTSRFSIMVEDNEFHIETPNVLSTNGVVHSVSDVHIPLHVDITPTDILHSVDARIFVDLLIARNLSQVLNPDNSYTILAPSDQALMAANVTIDTPDIDILLRLHVIPNNPVHEFLDIGKNVESLESGIHLAAKELNSGLFLVSIVEGDGREIRVLNRGDTAVRDASNVTTILYVDRFLSPDWISHGLPPFTPPFHLKTPVAILLGVVFGAMLIFGVLSCSLFVFLGRARAKAPASATGAGTINSAGVAGDNGDRRPLLSKRSGSAYSGRRSINGSVGDAEAHEQHGHSYDESGSAYGAISTRGASRRSSMRSMTSEHSVSDPISTMKVHKDREHGRHLGLPRV